jgi:hypothetical protein
MTLRLLMQFLRLTADAHRIGRPKRAIVEKKKRGKILSPTAAKSAFSLLRLFYGLIFSAVKNSQDYLSQVTCLREIPPTNYHSLS